MFKKKKVQKETHMSYFFGGTAIGMAAGLVAGKLFSNTLTEKTENFEHEVLINKNVNKYSQNDNIHNPYFHKNIHNCTPSKSASKYEDKNCTNQPLPTIRFNKFDDDDLKNNINNLDLNHKCDKNVQKVFYDDKNFPMYNISIEDNAKCNVSIDISSKSSKEEKKNNNYFELEDVKQQLSCTVQSEDDANTKDENLLKTQDSESTNNFNEEKTLERSRIHNSVELIDTFSALSINFCEGSAAHKNLQDVTSFTTNINVPTTYIDNVSHTATCNDTTHFKDEKGIDNLDFTSIQEFDETDLISSTRHNLEDN